MVTILTTLTGGTLGDKVGFDAGIQLGPGTGSGGFPTVPLFMAPGNGADSIQPVIAVPTPGGCAFDLQVQLSGQARAARV